MSKLIRKKLKIAGMYCTACAMNIDFDLEEVEGVKEVKTSYVRQETEVEFDGTITDLKKIFTQIKKTGYTAQEIS